MNQWHPLFVHLLRLLVGDWYTVEPEVPISDLPRVSDLLLVRREGTGQPPFRGLWSHLSDYNIIEFKGPTDSPDSDDLELLMAVGTGLAVRLNEERRRSGQSRLSARQVAFWYLAPNLGDTFWGEARLRSAFDYEEPGVWRGTGWGHRVWLVAYRDLAVGEDALPLHLLDRRRPLPEGISQMVIQRQELLLRFASFMMTLQPELWQEIRRMATSPDSLIDWQAVAKVADLREVIRVLPPEQVIAELSVSKAIDTIGLPRVIQEVGLSRVIQEVGLSQVIQEVGLSQVIQEVGLSRVIQEVGLSQVIQEVGLSRVIQEVGLARVVEEVGAEPLLEALLNVLPEDKARAIVQRLQQRQED